MDIFSFVTRFAAQFEQTPSDFFKADTAFREAEEWDSLIALSVIGMVDEDYGVKLTGDDIRNSVTINDIFAKIQVKMNA